MHAPIFSSPYWCPHCRTPSPPLGPEPHFQFSKHFKAIRKITFMKESWCLATGRSYSVSMVDGTWFFFFNQYSLASAMEPQALFCPWQFPTKLTVACQSRCAMLSESMSLQWYTSLSPVLMISHYSEKLSFSTNSCIKWPLRRPDFCSMILPKCEMNEQRVVWSRYRYFSWQWWLVCSAAAKKCIKTVTLCETKNTTNLLLMLCKNISANWPGCLNR